jgi:hypothetical protein
MVRYKSIFSKTFAFLGFFSEKNENLLKIEIKISLSCFGFPLA